MNDLNSQFHQTLSIFMIDHKGGKFRAWRDAQRKDTPWYVEEFIDEGDEWSINRKYLDDGTYVAYTAEGTWVATGHQASSAELAKHLMARMAEADAKEKEGKRS